MTGLRDTSSTTPDRTHTNQKDMEKIAHRFYQNLYTTDPTEAFSLDGREQRQWQTLLHGHHISQYYHASAPTAFRYLGFYICYSVPQRRYVENMLLEKIKNQIQAFTARGLSLRGRATIANKLILSRLWFTLRLLSPPKRFFEKLRSMIYTFVWQNKYPRVAFSQLCLDFTRGGVGLLEPSRQHLLLQMKWIFSIFSRLGDGLLTSALKYHLGFLSPVSTLPSLALFEPAFRSHPLCSHTLILPVIFRAFDHLGVQFDIPTLPVGLFLKLPLHRMFRNIPQNHWLHRHSTLLAETFLIVDPIQK
ncbi:hypothetical protein A0J61_10441 [Choanephora cucurbitarum]|uniref:Uncharacterized protein n=1 Tax=Choanephora cucurbitarum TaxID=101091 RepID=A0A1C7MXH0_9FUNG|nr:hypothetical protein A0J61_10441 [Choanephora cucurbitarum]